MIIEDITHSERDMLMLLVSREIVTRKLAAFPRNIQETYEMCTLVGLITKAAQAKS